MTKPKKTIRGRFEDSEIQKLVQPMNNNTRHKWARAGYPDVKQFLGVKLKRRRSKKVA
jgi:hypothetical protein